MTYSEMQKEIISIQETFHELRTAIYTQTAWPLEVKRIVQGLCTLRESQEIEKVRATLDKRHTNV